MPLGGGKAAIARSRDFTTSRLKEWKKKNEREPDWREPSLTGTYRGRPSMLKETLNRNNVSIEDAQMHADGLSDLLRNYRETAGKAGMVDKVDEWTKTCGKKGPFSFGHLSIAHGAESTSVKIQAANGDVAVTAGLMMTVILPFLYELPTVINDCKSPTVKVAFLVFIWAGVSTI